MSREQRKKLGRSSRNQSSPSVDVKLDGLEGVEQLITLPMQNQDRIIFLSGDINEQLIANIIVQLISMANQDKFKPIYLIVSTYGGYADEMFSLYDTIKFLPCPVRTIGMGKIMSAGVLLLASGEHGYREIGRSSRIMIHPISQMIEGNVFEIQAEYAETQRQQNLMIDLLVKETTMNKDQVKKLMKTGHNNYLSPTEAVKLGIVDRLVGE